MPAAIALPKPKGPMPDEVRFLPSIWHRLARTITAHGGGPDPVKTRVELPRAFPFECGAALCGACGRWS